MKMDLTSLSTYLSSSKRNTDPSVTKKTLGDIHVVLCNEASDLDSVVSSLITGYYIAQSIYKEEKENESLAQKSLVFSIINCTRQDLPLRTEVVYFLQENGIRLEHLICRDEIDLNALQLDGKLKLILVDHNLLAPADFHFSRCVYRVIDHHKRERPLDRRDTIEPVGSCCTLVGEMVLGLFCRDPIICRLLHGVITLDTYNLDPAAERTTPKDIKVIEELEEALLALRVHVNRNEVFKALVKARNDVFQLTAEQLLRKDTKIIRTPEMSITIPAVPILSKQLLDFVGIKQALKKIQHKNSCGAVVILCFRVSGTAGDIKKDVVVYSDSLEKARHICHILESSEMDLRFVHNAIEYNSALFTYNQGNITLSRKFVIPFLLKRLEGRSSINQNQLDLDALAGVEILLPNAGDISPCKLIPSPIPSISYSGVHSLGIGDPISQCGSAQNSAYNSCPYTPLNSCAEPADGYPKEYFLPSFNSREMIEKIELKRGKLRGYDKADDEFKLNACSSYPFTPKNSYVESAFEAAYEQSQFSQLRTGDRTNALHNIDSDLLLRKLIEKKRGESGGGSNLCFSSGSSKSQSMTKLNTDDSFGSGETSIHLGSPPMTPM